MSVSTDTKCDSVDTQLTLDEYSTAVYRGKVIPGWLNRKWNYQRRSRRGGTSGRP